MTSFMNHLEKYYWYIFFIAFFLVNENLIQWLLAVAVGNYSVIDGFQDAYKYFTLTGYVFFSAFRAIPYAILFFIIRSRIRKGEKSLSGIAWGGLVGILTFIILGSWMSLHSLYTDEHTSSTTAIAFIFIPIYAIVSGLIGGLIGYGVNCVFNIYTQDE
jgi:hypothetical protein